MSPPTSPISPSVKPGFEKVGLLPNERKSLVYLKTELLDHGGKHVAEVIDKQGVELIDADAAQDADAAEVNTGGETNVIAETFQSVLAPSQAGNSNHVEEDGSALATSARYDAQLHTPLEQLITPYQGLGFVAEERKTQSISAFSS
jgi:hypothetical protein